MSYPILLSLSYCFDQTSLSINPYEHLIGMNFILHALSAYLFNHLHNTASNAFNLLISSCDNVHISHPYNTTGHTNTFTILFFNILLNPFVELFPFIECILWPSQFRLFCTSLSFLPSSVITEPK